MAIRSYEEAGVDMRKGDAFADFIKSIPSGAVSKAIGGFAGGMPIPMGRWREPLLLSTTDGVGTKLLVAKALGRYDTIGIDLVAMNVNDLIVCGASPIQFLDYIACGRINDAILHDVIKGVVAGCEQAGCVLTGGETAEMPDLYAEDDIDLAGFAVGIVDKADLLPRLGNLGPGDCILGMPSTGVHSNGYSLARKCVNPADKAAMEGLLVPTKIYVKELEALIATGKVQAAAHITGSGLYGNIERVIPAGCEASFTWNWPVPPIFETIRKGGSVPEKEMRAVFNMGIGMAVMARRDDRDELLDAARRSGIALFQIGELVKRG